MKASIIIPVYNAEIHLPATIESIMQQDDSDFEVLLIDDCSTDNSLSICKEIESLDSRFRCIAKSSNTGPSATRNLGIAQAKGKYLLFLDSDDLISNKYVGTMTTNAEIQQADIVWCDFKYVFHKSNIFKPTCGHALGLISKMEYLQCFINNTEGMGSLWNKCYRSDFIKGNQILLDEDRVYGEDWDFNLQVALKNPKVYAISDILYYYMHYDSDSVSTRYHLSDFDYYCKSYEQLDRIAETYQLPNNHEKRSNEFVYNTISLLYKLVHSDLSTAQKLMEYKRITNNSLFRHKLRNSISKNHILTIRQKFTAYLLLVHLKYLAWQTLKI